MSRLSDLHKARSLKKARYWLGLSLRQMAALIKPTGDRPQSHLGKATIAAWENPNDRRKPSDEQTRQIGVAIANKLTEELKRTVGVKLQVNDLWHIKAYVECKDCRRWFEMKRETSRRCPRCLEKRKAKR